LTSRLLVPSERAESTQIDVSSRTTDLDTLWDSYPGSERGTAVVAGGPGDWGTR